MIRNNLFRGAMAKRNLDELIINQYTYSRLMVDAPPVSTVTWPSICRGCTEYRMLALSIFDGYMAATQGMRMAAAPVRTSHCDHQYIMGRRTITQRPFYFFITILDDTPCAWRQPLFLCFVLGVSNDDCLSSTITCKGGIRSTL